MKKTTALVSILSLLCIGLANAQTVDKPLSLQDCIRFTADKNSSILTARIQEEIAQKKVTEVIGSGLPQVSINGNLTDNLELPVQIIPGQFLGMPGQDVKIKFGTKYNTAMTGQLSQMIFNGSFWVGLDAAKQSNEYYHRGTEAVTDNSIYEVSVAFYKTLIAEKQIKLLEYNLLSLQKNYEDTRLMRDNGKAQDIDVDRIQVGCNNLKHQLQNANEQVKQAYNGLKYQMGLPVSVKITVQDTTIENPMAVSQIAARSEVQHSELSVKHEDRSDYRQLLTARELQVLNRKNEIAQYLPSLSAVGNYTWAIQKNDFSFDSKDWYKYYSVGLQLSIPLYTGGQRYARIEQADLNLKQLDEQLSEAGRGIDLQFANATISLNNARTNIESEKQNLELAEKVYHITETQYKEGVATSASLVDAEVKYREAQTNYISSLLNLYIARLEVEKAKGTIASFLNYSGTVK